MFFISKLNKMQLAGKTLNSIFNIAHDLPLVTDDRCMLFDNIPSAHS